MKKTVILVRVLLTFVVMFISTQFIPALNIVGWANGDGVIRGNIYVDYMGSNIEHRNGNDVVQLIGTSTANQTVVNADGSYAFTNLEYDTYSVSFTVPAGYESVITSHSGINVSNSSPIVKDMKIRGLGSVSGDIWLEKIIDGFIDSQNEFKVPNKNVKIQLYEYIGGNIPGILVKETGNNSTGTYNFSHLLPGKSYQIAVTVLEPGYLLTVKGNSTVFNRGTDLAKGISEPFIISPAKLNITAADKTNIGLIERKYAVSGKMLLDTNANGILETGENSTYKNMFPNSIRLIKADSTVINAVIDNTTGIYKIEGIPNYGTYTIEYDLPVGYVFPQSDMSLKENSTFTYIRTVEITEADFPVKEVNTAIYPMVLVKGNIWIEKGVLNGKFDNGSETIIKGATSNIIVTLYKDQNASGSGTIKDYQLYGGTNGVYPMLSGDNSFNLSYLPAGNYKLEISPPAGQVVSNEGGADKETNIVGMINGTGTVEFKVDGTGIIKILNSTGGTGNSVSDNILKTALKINHTISGTIWIDSGILDGTRSSNEVEYTDNKDVKIELYSSSTQNGVYTAVMGSEYSLGIKGFDAKGKYSFAYFETDKWYKVVVTAPQGYSFTVPNGSDMNVKRTSGNSRIAESDKFLINNSINGKIIDIGLYTGTVFGNFWVEKGEADGKKNAGEELLASSTTISISKKDANGNFGNPITQTVVNGTYMFTNLEEGTYKIKAAVPDGYAFTVTGTNMMLDGKGEKEIVINTQNNLNIIDAGFISGSGISGKVWIEQGTPNGKHDAGESIYAEKAFLISLYKKDSNGTFSASAYKTQTTLKGLFSFSDIESGTYKIKAEMPSGYKFTTIGSDMKLNSAGEYNEIVISPTQKSAVVSIGLIPLNITANNIATNDIAGTLWVDSDIQDGIRSSSEFAYNGDAKVELYKLNNGVYTLSSSTIMKNGTYIFGNLPAGTYKIKFYSPNGYSFTGSGTNMNVNSLNGEKENIIILTATGRTTIDAGIIQNPIAAEIVKTENTVVSTFTDNIKTDDSDADSEAPGKTYPTLSVSDGIPVTYMNNGEILYIYDMNEDNIIDSADLALFTSRYPKAVALGSSTSKNSKNSGIDNPHTDNDELKYLSSEIEGSNSDLSAIIFVGIIILCVTTILIKEKKKINNLIAKITKK